MEAHIIMLNDTPQVVVTVGTYERACEKMQELKDKHRARISYDANAPEFWHIRTVPAVSLPEVS